MAVPFHSRAPCVRSAPLWLVLACLVGSPPAAAPAAPAAPSAPANPAAGAQGFVVWESNRSGEFRIWRQDLAGGKPRPISADEPGRDHCCARLSPNGSRLVYLSLPGGAARYGPQAGVLRLVDADGGRDRQLVAAARHYGEHRAAVWWGEDDLVYIDERNATRELRLSTGATSELVAPPGPGASVAGEGWLLSPGGRIASGNTPTFSDFEPGKGVRLRPSLGGCQPAFSNDGRWAVWSAGAGGPIDLLDLATRKSWTVLEKGDPHLPAERGYVYFPMLSNDATLLAVGASPGEHDHFRADYDIYVLELDPAKLVPGAAAIAVAPHPGVDRFPDLYRPARPALVAKVGTATPASAGSRIAAEADSAAPAAATGATPSRRGLQFLWQAADRENRTNDKAASELLQPRGLAWIDRHRALALGGGSFAAGDASARRLAEALVAKHQLTVSLLLTPASLREVGPIVALSDGPRARDFVLRQEGARIVFTLRTSDSPKDGNPIEVARLTGTAPTHLLMAFSPGRLESFVDGVRADFAPQPLAVPGDLFPWRPHALTFGAEGQGAERWNGTLSEIAVWNRPLDAAEAANEAARVRRLVAARPAAARSVVEVRLRALSPVPSLAQISPYREALAVDEVELLRTISGPAPGARELRVARWAIVDGQTLPPRRVGESYRLVVEPFSSQPQLASYFLADRLPAAPSLPLLFDLGASAAP
jgi:hypothetical protein